MNKLIVVLCLLICGGMAQAQTATPTPTATPTLIAMGEGYYEFENLAAPNIWTSGSISSGVLYPNTVWTGLLMNGIGSTINFSVYGRWLVIQRLIGNIGNPNTTSVCVNGSCSTVNNYSVVGDVYQFGLDLGTLGEHRIRLVSTHGLTRIDNMLVLGAETGNSTPFPNPTPQIIMVPIIATEYLPTPTAVDMYDYVEVTAEVDGTPVSQVARVSYEVTAGDIMTNVMLMALFVLALFAIFLGFFKGGEK